MKPEYCTDCGRDRTPDLWEVTGISPAEGWEAQFAVRLAGDQEPLPGDVAAPDGSRWRMWSEPVIGWAVVLKHYEGAMYSGHESRIEPVLLAEDAYPVVMSDYQDERKHLRLHTRLVRAGGTG